MGKRVPPDDTTEILQLILNDPALWDALFPRDSFLGPKTRNKDRMPHWRATQSLTISVYSKKQGWSEEYRDAGLVEVQADGKVVPTERWNGEYGDPVRYHLGTLKGWMKKGKFLKEFNVDPGWTTWEEMPQATKARIRAEYPFYLLLHKLWSTPAPAERPTDSPMKKRKSDALRNEGRAREPGNIEEEALETNSKKLRRAQMPNTPVLQMVYAPHHLAGPTETALEEETDDLACNSEQNLVTARASVRGKRSISEIRTDARRCEEEEKEEGITITRGACAARSTAATPQHDAEDTELDGDSAPSSEVDDDASITDADEVPSSPGASTELSDSDTEDGESEAATSDAEESSAQSEDEEIGDNAIARNHLSANGNSKLLHKLVNSGHPQRLPAGAEVDEILDDLRPSWNVPKYFTDAVREAVDHKTISRKSAIAVTTLRLLIGVYTRLVSQKRYRADALNGVRVQLTDISRAATRTGWIARVVHVVQACGGVVCGPGSLGGGEKGCRRIVVGLRSPIDPEHVTPMTDPGSGRPATKLTALSLVRFIDSCHFTDTDDDTAQKRRYSAGRSPGPLPWALDQEEWFLFHRSRLQPGLPGVIWQRARIRLLLEALNHDMDHRTDTPAKRLALLVQEHCREAQHFDAAISKRVLALGIRAGAKICNDFAELSTRSKCTRVEAHSFTLPKSPAHQAWKGVSYVNENILDLLIRLDSLINRKRS